MESRLAAIILDPIGGRSFTDGGLWRSELGQTYLEEQDRAIQRGVRIQRVFVIDRQGLAATRSARRGRPP